MTYPIEIIDPPDVEPYDYGLLGIVDDIPWDPHYAAAGAQWESLASYVSQMYPVGVTQFGGAGGTKTWQTYAGVTKAWPFAAYTGISCGSIGHTPAEFEARALKVLELSEQHAAERALWAGGSGNTPNLNLATGSGGATDLTPAGTAQELTVGLGLLENWLADNYSGKGNVHARRAIAGTAAKKHLLRDVPDSPKPGWQTPVGTRWVFGGGYDGTGPAAAAPTATTTWVYITGAILLSRGEMELPADFEESLERLHNTEMIIAERPYLIGIDGKWAACKIDLTL